MSSTFNLTFSDVEASGCTLKDGSRIYIISNVVNTGDSTTSEGAGGYTILNYSYDIEITYNDGSIIYPKTSSTIQYYTNNIRTINNNNTIIYNYACNAFDSEGYISTTEFYSYNSSNEQVYTNIGYLGGNDIFNYFFNQYLTPATNSSTKWFLTTSSTVSSSSDYCETTTSSSNKEYSLKFVSTSDKYNYQNVGTVGITAGLNEYINYINNPSSFSKSSIVASIALIGYSSAGIYG